MVTPSIISDSASGTAYDDDADETGPLQPTKRPKTARAAAAGRGRPKGAKAKGAKAPRAKKQTKAELEQAYQEILRQNQEMRATQAGMQTPDIESSSASSRTGIPQSLRSEIMCLIRCSVSVSGRGQTTSDSRPDAYSW